MPLNQNRVLLLPPEKARVDVARMELAESGMNNPAPEKQKTANESHPFRRKLQQIDEIEDPRDIVVFQVEARLPLP